MVIRFLLSEIGYYIAGLNYVAYTLPIIAVAMIGLVFLDLKFGKQRSRYHHV